MSLKGYKIVAFPKPKVKKDVQKNKSKDNSRSDFLKFAAQKCR